MLLVGSGALLSIVGLIGVGAFVTVALDLPVSVPILPTCLLLTGGVMVVRGLQWTPEPGLDLPTHDELPQTDPRVTQPLPTRRRRWLVAASGGLITQTTALMSILATQGLPWLLRLALFVAVTILPTWGLARWLSGANGETSWPRR